MLAYLRKASRSAHDRGASAVEYGLMVAAIAAVIVGVIFGLGGLVRDTFSDTCRTIADGNPGGPAAPTTCAAPGGGG
jgi:pilus assembly protein Flp/PilA